MTLACRGVAHHIAHMSGPVDTPRIQQCPICSKPAAEQFRPFCSRRCADVDLNRWLSGVYVVPARAEEGEDGAAEGEELPADEQVRQGH